MNFLGTFLSALKPRVDDDVIDRLNYYYTCFILLLLAITISAKQYVGQPIQCWVPAQFTGPWEQYTENYCFVQNTYWLPIDERIPADHKERMVRQIGYYQWVPFVLAIQAMLFYVPCVIWRLLSWQSGINLQSIVTMATDSQNIGLETRERSVRTIARHVEDSLEFQRKLRDKHAVYDRRDRPIVQLMHYWRRTTTGTYVTALYLFVKLLYAINVVGQFFLLSSFLAPKYRFWGAEILMDLAKGREWYDSGHFPRVTMCDFEVKVLGNVHRYTVQCVLMINMFNEKVFLFLWWWFLFVGIADAFCFLYWLVISFTYNRSGEFVQRYLHAGEITEYKGDPDALPDTRRMDNRFVRKFITDFLRLDGIFILRMVSLHAGDLITTEIVTTLWRTYHNRYVTHPYAVEPPLLGDVKAPPYLSGYPQLQEKPSRGDTATLRQGDTDADRPRDDVGFIETYPKKDSNQHTPTSTMP